MKLKRSTNSSGYSVENLLLSNMLFKTLKYVFNSYFTDDLYGCEMWLLTLKKDHKLN